jgi:hypothetical protein
VNVTGWPAFGDGLTPKDTLAGCWSTTVIEPRMSWVVTWTWQ